MHRTNTAVRLAAVGRCNSGPVGRVISGAGAIGGMVQVPVVLLCHRGRAVLETETNVVEAELSVRSRGAWATPLRVAQDIIVGVSEGCERIGAGDADRQARPLVAGGAVALRLEVLTQNPGPRHRGAGVGDLGLRRPD